MNQEFTSLRNAASAAAVPHVLTIHPRLKSQKSTPPHQMVLSFWKRGHLQVRFLEDNRNDFLFFRAG